MMFCAPIGAQTSFKEVSSNLCRSGGVYFAYPDTFPELTPAPKGYKPFYVSHYGRHGSRYLISDNDYSWLISLFADASSQGALTPLGADAYGRMQMLWREVEGHGGDLSPVGVRQLKGIASRMVSNFPQAFVKGKHVSARSTVVMRCAMSMAAFGDKLKDCCPGLDISYESSMKYMSYMNYHADESNRFTHSETGPWVEEFRKFEQSMVKPNALVARLFSDSVYVLKKVNPEKLMWGLYWLASDMQDVETQLSFYDLFEPCELFNLWQCNNYRFYVGNANHPDGNGLVVANAKALLRNILDSANEAIANGRHAATVRFGHDGNVIPLLAILGIENFNVSVANPYELHKYWCDFKAAPMAANVQIAFYCKGRLADGDILVKVLHNEREVHIPVKTSMFPYYRWKDVEAYYRSLL